MRLISRCLYPNYQDRAACEKLVACLVSLGTNYLLGKDLHEVSTGFIAQTVLQIEGMSRINPVVVNNPLGYNSKLRDLLQDGLWECVKFFNKNNCCTCLKENNERLRTQSKLGECHGCHQSYECKKLMLCNQRKAVQYCSQECQQEDWPMSRVIKNG